MPSAEYSSIPFSNNSATLLDLTSSDCAVFSTGLSLTALPDNSAVAFGVSPLVSCTGLKVDKFASCLAAILSSKNTEISSLLIPNVESNSPAFAGLFSSKINFPAVINTSFCVSGNSAPSNFIAGNSVPAFTGISASIPVLTGISPILTLVLPSKPARTASTETVSTPFTLDDAIPINKPLIWFLPSPSILSQLKNSSLSINLPACALAIK